jgi:hypothetical protein
MKIFKYLGKIASEYFLNDQTIRVSQPKALNDPFELIPEFVITDDSLKDNTEYTCKFIIDKQTSSYKNYLLKVRSTETQKEKIDSNKILSQLNKEIGVICFTRADTLLPVNLLMWAHYSESHQGISVEFNDNCDFIKMAREVHYVKNRPVIDAKFLIENKTVSIDDLYFKSQDWQYENEVRITKKLSNCRDSGKQDSIGQLIYLIDIPIDSIKCIYLGCNSSQSLKSAAIKLHRTSGVKFMFLRVHNEEYKLISYTALGIPYSEVMKLNEHLLFYRDKI